MKLLIAGSRGFKDEKRMFDELVLLIKSGVIDSSVELVTDRSRGASLVGYKLFKQMDKPIHVIKARWNELGERAGYVRNQEITHACNRALIFWNGRSGSIKHLIGFMTKVGKPFTVVRYEDAT